MLGNAKLGQMVLGGTREYTVQVMGGGGRASQ